jgi:small-conductance mechanosensitive channel
MTKKATKAVRPSLLVLLGMVLAGISSVVSLIGMVAIAWEKFQTGRGWETYRTNWLVEFNWVGFLVLIAGVITALLIGLLFRFWEWYQLRELNRKYGKAPSGE